MERCVRIVLKQKLEEMNITRYELAKRTNIKYQTIDNYDKNRVVRYDSDLLLKICTALECDVGDIIKIVNR